MRLILLRHAKSDKAEPGMGDHERTLNPRGRGDAARIGAYLARHALIPDRVLVSTARRTRETWEGVAAALSATPVVTFEDRLYNGSADALLAVIKETERTTSTLLVIGHNPGMQELAMLLVASGDVDMRERLHEGLPTSGLVVIDFAAQAWSKLHAHGGRLERFITPRSLAATDPA